jgi:hypothetical protein
MPLQPQSLVGMTIKVSSAAGLQLWTCYPSCCGGRIGCGALRKFLLISTVPLSPALQLKPPTHAALAKAAAVLAAEELGGPAVHQGGAQGAQVRSPRSLQTGIVEFLKQQEQVPPPPKRSLMPASEGSLNGLAAAVQAAPVPPAPTPTAAVSQLSQDGHLLSAPTSHLKDGYSGGRHGSAAGTGIVAAAPAAADPEGKDKPARSRSRLFSFLH